MTEYAVDFGEYECSLCKAGDHRHQDYQGSCIVREDGKACGCRITSVELIGPDGEDVPRD